MSDFAQTVSYDRLPQRMAARIDLSCFTCATRSSSASANFFWMDAVPVKSPSKIAPHPSGEHSWRPPLTDRRPGPGKTLLAQSEQWPPRALAAPPLPPLLRIENP